MADMKRTIKDSVFSYLFRQPEYTLELYKTLHPEDNEATEDDLNLITIENVLSNGLYNDLGLLVRNTLIVLMEAQSTFSYNITLRLLLYLAETYKEYVETNKLDLYAGMTVQIPRPELYVVYTGARRNVPDVLRLSDLYEGTGGAEITVQVIRSSGGGSIVDQYIRFCEIVDAERKKYGYTQEAVDETIRRCLAENILTPFLASRQKEVQSIMLTLFSEEKISEIHDYNLVKRAKAEARAEGIAEGRAEGIAEGRAEGIAEGRAEGIAEGRAEGIAEGRAEALAENKLEIAKKLLSIQLPHEQIAMATGLSLADVEKLAV